MILLLSACTGLATHVTMTGTVEDEPYAVGDVVGGATVQILDEDQEEFDSVTAGADGSFEVEVPAGVGFYAVASADGYLPTAFSGTAGSFDFGAPEGYPWVASESWLDEQVADFAACPTIGDEGSIVLGEVRVDEPGTPYGNMTVVPYASVRVFIGDDTWIPACYLDDDGASLADGTETGATGRFIAFGVPPGEIVVEVSYDLGDTQPVELYQFVAPEGGVVPMYPALVEFPY